MSVRVMGFVWEHFPDGGSLLLTMLALADHADHEGGSVFPSNAQLAQKTRQSERTIQYQRRRIEALGWLVAVANEAGGRGRATEYRIPIEDLASSLQSGAQEGREKGATPAPIELPAKGAKGATPAPIGEPEKGAKGARAAAPQSSEKTNTPPYSPPKGERLFHLQEPVVRSWFDSLFWPAYPKRVGRGQALDELLRLEPDEAMLAAILEGVKQRTAAEARAKASGQFFPAWPDPHRYLKRRRWEDVFDVPRETAETLPRRCCRCGASASTSDRRGHHFCREHDPDLAAAS